MSVFKITKEFKEETWVDLFKAIEHEWIFLWMWYITDEMELADKIYHEFWYLEKINTLKNIYKSKLEISELWFTKEVVIAAIKTSIKNSFVSNKISRKDCIYSKLLLTNSRAVSILSKYDWTTNPLIYKITDNPNAYIKSIVSWEILWLEPYKVSNWFNANWDKTFRIKHYLARPWMFRLQRVMKIECELYHPIVWYCLEQWTLDVYLTDDVLIELRKYIAELSLKQMNKVSNLINN